MPISSRSHFWALCALGIWGLWGTAYFDGMFDRLDVVLSTRRLPDERMVRDSYTGIPLVDQQLALVAVFYGLLTDRLSSGPRLLFFDINAVVSCTNLWTLIESRRTGTRSWLLKYPAWAMLLWNFNGAAIFQPPYFYLLSRSKACQRDSSISIHDALAVLVCTIPIMATPLVLFIPAWLGLTTWEHHGYIALFHASPLITSGVYWATSTAVRSRYMPSPEERVTARRWIVLSLVVAGIWAGVIHIYTVLGALTTNDPDASLFRVFVPAHGRSNPFPHWIETMSSPTKGLPREYGQLLENFHLFSQYDWLVVSLSCILFVHIFLHGRNGEDEGVQRDADPEESWNLMYLTISSLLIGPGAAGSFALAIRESNL